MQLGDRGYQGQAETTAGRGTTRFQPIEALKHLRAPLRGNAGTVIGHAADDAVRPCFEVEGNDRPSRGMPDCVLDQICKHLNQELAVAPDDEPACDARLERLAAIFSHRGVGIGNSLEYLRKIDNREGCPPSARLDLRDPQEGRKGAEDGVGLGNRLIHRCLVIFHRSGARPRSFEALSQSAQGSAQIMGDVARHLS